MQLSLDELKEDIVYRWERMSALCQTAIILSIAFLLFSIIIFFLDNNIKNEKEEHRQLIISKFNGGNNIYCWDDVVHNKDWNYVVIEDRHMFIKDRKVQQIHGCIINK